MPELIDKQAVRLLESDADAYTENWNDDYEKGFCDAIYKVLELPTIEAEPVRHGLLDEDKPLTNGDRIRAMTDEELAYFLTTTSCSICCDHPLNCGFDCASLYAIKAEKTEQVSLLDRLAAEYDRKHPNGLKFVYSLDGETPQTEQGEKENG